MRGGGCQLGVCQGHARTESCRWDWRRKCAIHLPVVTMLVDFYQSGGGAEKTTYEFLIKGAGRPGAILNIAPQCKNGKAVEAFAISSSKSVSWQPKLSYRRI